LSATRSRALQRIQPRLIEQLLGQARGALCAARHLGLRGHHGQRRAQSKTRVFGSVGLLYRF